ncbi:MAG: ATP-binding protein [Sphingobacteriales bacterium]|nr:ATP-binding protein [Sphingobacteriales bacterium]MBI3720176.1 ATP-binding protein [Sphingobacteriales bacterium]
MIERQLSKKLKQLYRYFPVVSLNGPRQSGKSTLLKNTFPKLPYVTLENPDDLQIALADPRQFLSRYNKGAVIDEVQNVPALFSYIQGIVDSNNKIKFVLSGSQNFLLNQHISQTLAGRVGLLTLLPFSITELKNAGLLKRGYEQTVYTGFYPRLFDKKIPPSLFYPSYLQTYVQRDVLQLLKITDIALFTKFIRLLAGRVGQLVNLSSLASDVGVAVNTIKAWIAVMESSYILFLLKPHHQNFAKRLVQQPKIYFYDTGLLCYLLGIETPKQLDTHYARGNIFENMVLLELLKNRYNDAKESGLFFWRDKHGKEVDCIIESAGKLFPIEIKSSQTKSLHLLDNIKYYLGLAKNKSKKGYVVYGGNEVVNLKEGSLIPWNSMEELFKL